VLEVLAVAVAVGVAALGLSLPGITVRGAAIGGFFALAGILTWTATTRPVVIWAVLAVSGVVYAVWARPWRTNLRALPRLGGAWLGLAYWVLGVAGAVLVGHAGVALQRVAYAGVFTLAAMAVVAGVRPPRTDLSIGIAAAFLVAVAALLLAGAGNLFDSVHPVPDRNPADLLMRGRFWGGPLLYYHPNSMAGLAVVAALRIGPDRALAAWQRLAATVVAGFVLYLTNSRIAFVFALAAALVHAVLLWRDRHAERRPWRTALVPFAVLAAVLVLSGGRGFLVQDRFGGGDVTSGRVDTWRQVATDWRDAGWAEKAFGDTRTSRAVVFRTDDGAPPGAPRLKLNTDNAAVGALRHGGVLGVLCFLLGLGLLVRHALRRGSRWFTVAALAALPTIATEDWLLGGTNGGIWILLLAGEAWQVSGTHVQRDGHVLDEPQAGQLKAGP
jgi:O-Antigen ligase